MSIYFSGTRSRSKGVISAIAKALRTFTLKPCQNITVDIDPFRESTKETRDFLHYISAPKILATNLNCKIKTNILCDRSLPQITFKLDTGNHVIMKSENLTSLNILQLYNKHISILNPKEIEEEIPRVSRVIKKRKEKINYRKLYGRPFAKRRAVVLQGKSSHNRIKPQ